MLHRLLLGALGELASFFSLHYVAFFLPAAVVGYSIVPKKLKKYALLLGSWGFFFLISGGMLIYLWGSVLSIWGFGILLGRMEEKKSAEVKAAEKPKRKAIKQKWLMRSRWVLGAAALVHIGGLLVLKYTGFFLENVNAIFGLAIQIPQFWVPIGLSFFSLQAFSYLFDVYRGVQKPDKNIARLALWLSFFPQIVEGPIVRYSQTAQQLWEVSSITWENLTGGLQRILWGLMKKLVVADRLNAFVEAVFSGGEGYEGGIIALAAVCYTIQLYMDFSGAMDAVCGTAQIFGVIMPENFQRPFFSRTISEFWSRWHISLGTFFKDYIFYPVTMSKPLKNLTTAARKRLGNHFGPLVAGSIALFCVWFSNGLWHGAAWSYIFFGMYHFALILTGSLMAPAAKWGQQKFGLKPERWAYRGLQLLRTCILVVIGELLFRAESLKSGLAMFGKLMTDFRFTTLNAELLESLSIDGQDFFIVAVTLVIVLAVGILQERGIRIREAINRRPIYIRWAIWLGLILFIATFGAYGVGYIPVDPMYAQF